MKILLVEDNPDLLDVTAYALRRERMAVTQATDGSQALRRWKTERPDLVVLDLGLPGPDGFEVLRRIREVDTTPVIVLTGSRDETNIVRCFNLGVDDYVTKPFSAKELAMRIRAVLRRVSSHAVDEPPVMQVGDMRIDVEAHEVTTHGRRVRLTPIEVRIFHLLAQNIGRVVTLSRLHAYVWGQDGGDVRALRTHITHIREKLDIDGAIRTVPAVGYRFDVPTSVPDVSRQPATS